MTAFEWKTFFVWRVTYICVHVTQAQFLPTSSKHVSPGMRFLGLGIGGLSHQSCMSLHIGTNNIVGGSINVILYTSVRKYIPRLITWIITSIFWHRIKETPIWNRNDEFQSGNIDVARDWYHNTVRRTRANIDYVESFTGSLYNQHSAYATKIPMACTVLWFVVVWYGVILPYIASTAVHHLVE